MADIKLNEPFSQKSDVVKPQEVLFMGGRAVITPGGSFSLDGKIIDYPAKVKLGSLPDKNGNISPACFLAMVRTVAGDKKALDLLEKL